MWLLAWWWWVSLSSEADSYSAFLGWFQEP
jgi:hypothetical protein